MWAVSNIKQNGQWLSIIKMPRFQAPKNLKKRPVHMTLLKTDRALLKTTGPMCNMPAKEMLLILNALHQIGGLHFCRGHLTENSFGTFHFFILIGRATRDA